MKFLILALAVFAVASGQHHGSEPERPIAILRQVQDNSADGSYNYAFETENGIAVSERGSPGPVNAEGEASIVAEGQYQYRAQDGTLISVSYVANENGFQPQGDHLPVAPEIPHQIQRALDYIAAHPSRDLPQQQQTRYNVGAAPSGFPRPIPSFRAF